jgi:hypothetical protein
MAPESMGIISMLRRGECRTGNEKKTSNKWLIDVMGFLLCGSRKVGFHG